MRISARNQLPATVDAVKHGEVMSTVVATLAGGEQITAAITTDSAEEFELAPGHEVIVVIKSTEVMIARPD